MARVCAVVLNWNGFSDTVECLESLMPSVADGKMSAIVVDNASTDGSADRLEEWINKSGAGFELIHSDENKGYAGGNNLGIRRAMEQGCEFVWILNNDVAVREDALDNILKCADENKDAAVIGSTIVDYGGDRVQCAGGAVYNPWLTVYHSVFENEKLENVISVKDIPRIDYMCGAAMLIRAEALEKAGLLSEDYFLYFEEIDFAMRSERMEYRSVWCPGSVIFHKGGASAGSRSSTNMRKSSLSEYHSNLSALIFTRKFYSYLLPAAFAARFLLKTLKFIIHGELYLFRPILAAYGDFLTGKRSR